MNNTSLIDLIRWVESQPRFKPKSDLTRMKNALKMKGIELKHTYMIHVAGTNGKGSVTQYLTQILKAQGLKVGTYTSPYILKFNERISVNGLPIDDEDLFDLLSEIKSFHRAFESTYKESLSFFELLTIAAMSYFQKEDIEVGIIEVGIGGLLDATNAYEPYDLSLITNIGFDHMKQLGYTLESIAYNKLGILRENGVLLSTVDPVLHDYFKTYTNRLHVDTTLLNPIVHIKSYMPLVFEYKNHIYEPGLLGDYQVKNAILAIEAALKMPFNISQQTIQYGLKQAYLPARMEMIRPQIYVDGAHNTHAIDALEESVKAMFKDKYIHIIFSALADKDIKGMLTKLKPFSNHIDLVSFPDPRFEPLDIYEEKGITYIKEDVLTYLKKVIEKKDDHTVVIITGSLHFVGYILNDYK